MTDHPIHRRPRAVVFDLDGTLVDSAPDLAASLNRLLQADGRGTLAVAEVTPMVGDGISKLVERALAATGTVPAGRLHSYVERFSADYLANAAVLTKPYPRVLETLTALGVAGHPLAVCTNKPIAATNAVLRAVGLARFFAVVIGGDSLPARKPDPAPLRAAMERVGAVAENTLMVGDSENDLAMARAASVPAVLVTYGYCRRPVAELDADALMNRFDELPGILDKF